MKKTISMILVLATLLLALVACGSAKPKEFTTGGMYFTLTDDFRQVSVPGYTACYESSKVAVFVLKESFSLQAGLGNKSLDEYAQMVRKNNSSKSPSDILKSDGLTYMEYKFYNAEYSTTYKYFCTMYKSSDAFWLIQFTCSDKLYADYKSSFVNWAKTVSFAN